MTTCSKCAAFISYDSVLGPQTCSTCAGIVSGQIQGLTGTVCLNAETYYTPPAMSLRDYFAGQFTAAWIITLSVRYGEAGWSDEAAIQEANRLGLIQADAMLKAREK